MEPVVHKEVVTVAITIQSNISSLRALRQLSSTGSQLTKVFERLSTGQRINHASDDAASLALASNLNVSSKIFQQGIRNANDGVSLFNIADQTLDTLTSILERQTELAEQSANGTLSSTQRSALDEEYQSLAAEYDRIYQSAEFNGVRLFDSGVGGANLQVGESVLSLDYLNLAYQFQGTGTFTTTINNTKVAGGDLLQSGLFVTDINLDGYDDIVSVTAEASTNANDLNITTSTFFGSESGPYTTTTTKTEVQAVTKISAIEQLLLGIEKSDDSITLSIYVEGTDSGGTFAVEESALVEANGDISYLGGGGSYGDVNLDGTLDINGDGVLDSVSISGSEQNLLSINVQDTETVIDYESLAQTSSNVTSVLDALSALNSLEELRTKVQQSRGLLGAGLSRIDSAIRNLQSQELAVTEAASRLTSADTAEEAAKLARLSILQEAGAAVLSQANQQPQLTLLLLKPPSSS
ncbi:MAG: hypothetical protein KDD70_02200 [Bdellovibrionales bacterium]|nr:hypothetical protein [Bdellovibrionales bacterium]